MTRASIKSASPSNFNNTNMMCWSSLPDHLLGLVIEKLSLTDYMRFGAVCVSWNALVNKKEYRPKPQPPWLMLRPIDDENYQAGSAKFFSLTENKTYTIPLPPPLIGHRNILGCSFGWLITIDDTLEMHLLNPLTRVQTQLPSITTLPSICSGPKKFSPFQLNKDFVSKAILSSAPSSDGGGDYTVIIWYGPDKRRARMRSGDSTWTIRESGSSSSDVDQYNGQLCLYTGRVLDQNCNARIDKVSLFVFDCDKESRESVDADGLKDNALLYIDQNCSVLFSTVEHPELRPKCIYCLNAYHFTWDRIRYNLVMFDMECEGGTMINFPGVHLLWHPPVWITPNLF